MSLAELLHLQQGLIAEPLNGVPEDYFLMDHPDYLEDDFYPEDYFVWPVGHSDYPDLTKNDPPADDVDLDVDEDQQDGDELDSKELDVIDPVNHPVHWIPDREVKRREYDSFDKRHHSEYHPDDGPPADYSKLHTTHESMTAKEAE